MACHTCNMPFMALNMRDPISVEAECPEHDGDTYPANSKIKFEFPELNGRAAFTLHWYDGGNLPPSELFKGLTLEANIDDKKYKPPAPRGCLVIGDKATMYAAGDYADSGHPDRSAPKNWTSTFPAARATKKSGSSRCGIRRSRRCRTSRITAGPLTETILLGNLAVYKRGRVEWDPVNLKPLNDPMLMHIVRPTFRDGYEV